MKKTLCIAIALMIGLIAMAQQTVKHVVARGETIESIASRYGTTTQQIIALNPDAAQFVYVGMELTIPVSSAANSTQTGTTNQSNSATFNSNASTSVPQSQTSTYADGESTSETSKWAYSSCFYYGFLGKEKVKSGHDSASSTNWTYGFAFGADYYFYEGAYIGAKIGYAYSSAYSSVNMPSAGVYATTDATYHFITIPIEIGYKIGKSFAIVPHIGVDLNPCVAAKAKLKSGKEEIKRSMDKPFAVCFTPGIHLSFGGFRITGKYNMPLAGKEAYCGKNGYFSVGIGFGF